MRDLALVLGMLFYLPVSLRAPAAGAMCWVWFSIMNPHRQVYGFTYGQPLNSIIAGATLIGWFASRERKRWTPDAVPWLMLALMVWMTISTMLAVDPDYSWLFWDRTIRLFAVVFLVFFLFTTKARIHGMVWVLLISLGFYGVKGGVFTIAHGGHAIVFGPEFSVYNDNNQLALAVVTELPLVYYVWRHTQATWLRMPTLAALVLQVIMVFGSYSRGGVIALSVMMAMFWLRSDRKIVYGMIGAAVVLGGLSVMPDTFFSRLNTLNDVGSDDSFQGRVMAWQVAYHYALEHFPLGFGFNGGQLSGVFEQYFKGVGVHAAHSIYFQILGDHGFLGLGLYLAMLLLALRNAGIVIRQTRDNPDLIWARDLADMMRVSLIAFFVGGAALSMAYSDVYLILIALLSCLREITQPQLLAAAAKSRERRLGRHAAGELEPAGSPVPAPMPARGMSA